MTQIEKFGLVTGIVGVIADTIGIGAFLFGVWSLDSGITTSSSSFSSPTPPMILGIMGLIIIYSWIVISWTLSRRKLVLIKKHTSRRYNKIVDSAVSSVAVLITPTLIGFLLLISQNISYVKPEDIKRQANTEATRVARLVLTPQPTAAVESITRTPTPMSVRPVEEIELELESNARSAYIVSAAVSVVVGLFIYFIMGVIVSNSVGKLMLIIYDDLDILIDDI